MEEADVTKTTVVFTCQAEIAFDGADESFDGAIEELQKKLSEIGVDFCGIEYDGSDEDAEGE